MKVAIDARLMYGTSTGDSTYWTCLVEAMFALVDGPELLLFSNVACPVGVPHKVRQAWIHLPSDNARLWSWVRFPLAAKRMGADLVHTQYALSPLVGRRGVTTIHDVSFFVGPQWFKPRDRFLLQRSVPAACRRARRILAVSATTEREINQYIPGVSGKIRVTPNACPPWIARPSEDEIAETLDRLGVKTPYVLTVGTRWPRKNMELALAACDRLPASLPHRLIVTGKHGYGPSELGTRGQSVGYVSNQDLCALYSAAALYLAPSHHEGFGIPLLEAFRLGCPVVCSAGGALPEVAADAAVVIGESSAAVWAGQIEELLQSESKLAEYRERGRARERAFDWHATATATVAAYKEALL